MIPGAYIAIQDTKISIGISNHNEIVITNNTTGEGIVNLGKASKRKISNIIIALQKLEDFVAE